MASFNKVILAGNITRAPEMRYTPKGTAITKVGLAVNRAWKDNDGKKHEDVLFVDVDFFGKTAETISEWFNKGSAILIEGRLKLDTWEDKKTKEQKQRIGVVGESFSFIDSAAKANGKPAGKRATQPASAPAPASDAAGEPDDVPF